MSKSGDILELFLNVLHGELEEWVGKATSCCVPVAERMVSPLDVRSLGIMLYSHHVRFVSSRQVLAPRDIIRLQAAVSKALTKSSSRMASPFIAAYCASSRTACILITYPP